MESQAQPTRFSKPERLAAVSALSALASGRLSRPARIQRWGAAFDASVKYGTPMKANTVNAAGYSLLQGGASQPQCLASGRSGVSASLLWHLPRPNPSVKGTSTSGLHPLAAAPYLER
jgi:hypothetical protein